MSMEVLDSVFGSCFRSVIWGTNGNQRNKYIDYMPSKKWKYKDENLMHELTDRQSWDAANLTEDELYEDRIPNNIKVRLHDNVFLNPLNENNNVGKNSNNHIEKQSTPNITNENTVLETESTSKADDKQIDDGIKHDELKKIDVTSKATSSCIVDITPHEVKSPTLSEIPAE